VKEANEKMKGNLDSRRLLIREYGDPLDESTLRSLATFAIPTEEAVDLDDLSEKAIQVIEAINQDKSIEGGIAGYEIVDTRRITRMGASAAIQEILIAIATGVAEGAAGALIYGLSGWLVQKYKKKDEPRSSLEVDVERAKRIVLHTFNPRGSLDALEVTPSRVVFEDRKGDIFEAETVPGNPGSLHIRKRQRNS
jgi:hypothetical protein